MSHPYAPGADGEIHRRLDVGAIETAPLSGGSHGVQQGGEIPSATLDEFVDAVVDRIEQRVVDELERRGRANPWAGF